MKKIIALLVFVSLVVGGIYISSTYYEEDIYTSDKTDEIVLGGIEEVKSRPDFIARMKKIEEIEAKKIYLAEQKQEHSQALAKIESELEAVRGDEISFE